MDMPDLSAWRVPALVFIAIVATGALGVWWGYDVGYQRGRRDRREEHYVGKRYD